MDRFDPNRFALQVKITLDGVAPPIWRRLHLPKDLNFAQLHEVIQAAFGWTDSHLHQFVVGGLILGAPEFDEDGLAEQTTFEATNFRLSDLDLTSLPSLKILYEYDFGDSWRHWIAFENVVPKSSDDVYPKLVDGARHCPPEDVGGPGGYDAFLKAWRDPRDPDHKHFRRWAGKAFDPEAFDRVKTQKAITAALKRCRGNYRFRQDS